MLDEQLINNIMRMNLKFIESGTEFIDKCHSILKEPLLYIQVTEKRLLLESIRDMKRVMDKIIKNMVSWDKTSRKDLMIRINNEVMHLVYNYRDIQHHFNTKFESNAYINIKIEEWRRYVNHIANAVSQNEYTFFLEKYKVKLDIDFEIQHLELLDKEREWTKLIIKEESIESIFHTEWLQKIHIENKKDILN
jgi:hypothetical protein